MSFKNLLIIDCDCGIDDALAILLAIASKKEWSLKAITCTYGNISVDNACKNVGKVLQFCKETQIPIYKGCTRPLLKKFKHEGKHGEDGFGNIGYTYPHDRATFKDDHAVNALINLAKIHKSEGIHLVVLGPLTNIAIAHRLDPDFTKKLKSIHFMGGNIECYNNADAVDEFNFASDPEAANIILTECECPIAVVPWETTINHGIPWDVYETMLSAENERCYFLKKITKFREELCKKRGNPGFLDCDFLAVAALINPKVIQEISKCTLKENKLAKIKDCTNEVNLTINVINKFNNDFLNELRYLITEE